MQILPLKFIHESDKTLVGTNLYNLSRLKNSGLPVIDSIIVLPPLSEINDTIKKFLRHASNLRDHKSNFRQKLMQIKIPEGLENLEIDFMAIKKNKTQIDIDKLWENLLNKWSDEIISKIERGDDKFFNLTPQQIVFSSAFDALGLGFFDEDRDHVVIETTTGKINFEQSEKIENIIKEGNKKLVFPQIYYWVLESGEIKIIKLAPFTQSLPKKQADESTQITTKKEAKVIKTATRVFIDYSGEMLNKSDNENIFLRINKNDVDQINLSIEKILNSTKDPNIIFYPDLKSQEEYLKFAEIFLFFRNKKKLSAQIVLPRTFSIDEFLILKRQFASLGIYSKGSLKLWKEFSNIADFINLEDYIEAGFDGALINLDKIAESIIGLTPQKIMTETKLDYLNALEKFFDNSGFKKLIKEKKPVLIFGETASNEELLNYFLKSGIWGLIYKENVLNPMKEHISFLEKQFFKKLPLGKVDK